jgi:hypothetical protein
MRTFAQEPRRASSFAPPSVHHVLRSAGRPLDGNLRALLEPRFGHDFSRVRVHTDEPAAESARAVNALAYTVGHDIVFGPGQFAPHTHTGRALLTHELTHVAHAPESAALSPSLAVAPADHSQEIAAQAGPHSTVTGTTGGRPMLFRQIVRDNPFGPGTAPTPATTAATPAKPAPEIIRDNPFIPSGVVPDLPEATVKKVAAAIAQRRFQDAINLIIEESALGAVAPVMINRSLLENRTMAFDASLGQEGRTEDPAHDRNGDPLPVKVSIGPPAFQHGAPWLFSTIAHEYVHVLQAQRIGTRPSDPRLGPIQVHGSDPRGHGQEVEAYAREILSAAQTGLKASPPLIEELWRRLRNDHWIRLMHVMKLSLTDLVNKAFAAASSIVGAGKLMPP